MVLAVLAGYSQWVNVGPEGGEITTLVQSTQNPSDLYAVSGYDPSMVMFSQDSGASWENIGSFSGGPVYDITMTSSGTLVAFGGHRVWRSTDGGVNWTSISVTNTYLYQGAAHPTDGNTVYAAAYRYIDSYWRIAFMKSVDGGLNWTAVQLTFEPAHAYGRSISVSQSDPDVIILGGYEPLGDTYQRLYLSEDGGTTFSEITPPCATNEYYTYGVAIHPEDPDIMLAGTQNSVYRSTDRGANWTKTASQYYNYRIRYSLANPEIVFAGGSSNIYRSINGGITWTSVTTGLSGTNFQDVIPSYDSSDLAFTGSTCGFFRSSSGGTSWALSVNGLLAGKVLVGCKAGGYVYIQLQALGMFRCADEASVNWIPITSVSGCGDLAGMVSDGEQMLLALEAGG